MKGRFLCGKLPKGTPLLSKLQQKETLRYEQKCKKKPTEKGRERIQMRARTNERTDGRSAAVQMVPVTGRREVLSPFTVFVRAVWWPLFQSKGH